MSGFNSVKPKHHLSKNFRSRIVNTGTMFSRLYNEAINTTYSIKTGRPPAFRPSAFPQCSVLLWIKMVKGASLGYWETDKSFAGDFFTSIGTQAHTVTQYHIGDSGKIWGNWKCINPKCSLAHAAKDVYDKEGNVLTTGKLTRKHTTRNRCPECKDSMEYVEIEISYKGLKGHIDCIIYLGNGQYWVGDYKTTTKYKLTSGKLPEKSHLMQIPTYVWVLRNKYKMNVVGFSLLYLSRDNPFNFVEKHFTWNDEWEIKTKKLINSQRLAFVAALHSLKTKNFTHAIENKLCCSESYYHKNVSFYTECPMLKVCFQRKKLEQMLQLISVEFPYTKQQANSVYEQLKLK